MEPEDNNDTKKKLIIGSAIFVILTGLAIWGGTTLQENTLRYDSNRSNDSNNTLESDYLKAESKTETLCFFDSQKTSRGLYDKQLIRLTTVGEKVTGEYNWYPAEKDSKIGIFEGTIGPIDSTTGEKIATLWWNSTAEGVQNKEELIIKLTNQNASVGFGAMKRQDDGSFVYADKSKVRYSTLIPLADCNVNTLNEGITNGWGSK